MNLQRRILSSNIAAPVAGCLSYCGDSLSRYWFALCCLMITSHAVGCRGGLFADSTTPQTFVDSPDGPNAFGASSSVGATATDDETSEAALIAIADELTELGALDDESKRELMSDLREAKPENWPYIVKMYRSTLAYRKQLAERERQPQRDPIAERSLEKFDDQVANRSTAQSRHRDPRARANQLAPDSESLDRQVVDADARPTRSVHTQDPLHVAAANDSRTQAVVLSKPPRNLPKRDPNTKQASYRTPPLDWEEHLRHAVGEMQTSLPSDPASTDEVNEHMRLRLLQLLAGDQEGALQPIPGATAPQQDYWSQQLFAVSTFLDSQTQPDNKRRATGSLTYLDQARAKLAELATLQVKNLAFVDSVGGYGDYALRENGKFRPGDSVTLYAEIENHTSQSTKEGHRTRLGTSFEILDNSGKRVDSAQFPEVEDLCKTPRRDFHIQYTITLPTRIYAEEYEIRLIVTDEQSKKIGQASLPLEIVE